ncbi:hypothetical protein [Leifsonia sp. NPDC058248]|uniref:hypothetical protein n=1 Tax=Leifsonia sp. NPDC058248 TaxID=3346402 RepID=UPI0036D8C4F0
MTRGLLASGIAIFVAALFHVAGGGAAPGPLPLALSLAFATLASIALAGRRLSLWRLTVSVVLSQFLFHLLFGLGTGTATLSPAGEGHVHLGSHLVMSVAAGASGHADMGVVPSSASMWFSHAAAALVTVVALRFGERAFWELFETARMGVARFAAHLATAPVTLFFTPATAVEAEPSRLQDLGIPLGRLRHRGPPRAAVAF